MMDSFKIIDTMFLHFTQIRGVRDVPEYDSSPIAFVSTRSVTELDRPIIDEDHWGHGGFSAMCIIA
jgi:hypothetical protein